MAAASSAKAEPDHPETAPAAITLHVIATDASGKTISDLTASDFRVFDNGKPQQVTGFHFDRSSGPKALVILFDLLNLNLANEGYEWQAIRKSVPEMPAGESLYLYLLTKNASVYPVHGLPASGEVPETPDTSWIQNIGPLLNTAMQKVNQLRPEDLRTQVNLRFKATYDALYQMGGLMSQIPGRKELLWVTYGIPSSLHLVSNDWFDCTPSLRQLAGQFNQANVSIYTMDPGLNLNRGLLDRQSLDTLTGNTAGRSLSSSDLRDAVVHMVADARASYSLQYIPSVNNWNGKYHALRVACERKGVHVQTERGYLAALPR